MRRLPQEDLEILVHPLAYVRAEREWSYRDLVNIIARRAGNIAARREKAWKWEHWGTTPDRETQLALAAELGVPTDVVNSLGWPAWLPVGERPMMDLPWTVDTSVLTLDRTAGAARMDRRGFLITGSGAMAATASRWLNVEPPRLATALRGGPLDEKVVGCFEEQLPVLRRMDFALGGGSVRDVADANLRLATDLLAKGSYSEQMGRRMFAVAGELGRIAGWASFDTGHHAAAERYWLAALRAAHTSGDRGIGANILKCMSLQLAETDRHNEAVSIVEAAREGTRGAPARIEAMLTVRQARTHAARGETADCERLLAMAETAMGRADDETAPDWAMYFDKAEYCAQVAACYLLLRRHQATNHWLTQTLQLQPAVRERDRSTYLLWHADAVLELGDVDHACDLITQALPSIASIRSQRNRNRLRDLHTRVQARGGTSPAVRALDDQLHALIA